MRRNKQRQSPARVTTRTATRWWKPARLLQLFMIAVLIISLSPTMVLIGMFNKTSFATTVSQGPRSATGTSDCINATGVGTVAWTNPGQASAAAGTGATVSVDGTTSNYIRCTNFGFSIPSGVTIEGIVLTLHRFANSTGNGGSNDAAIRLVRNGTIGTTDRSTSTTYATTETAEAHGGSTDLWGTSWTNTLINASNFGAAIAVTKPSSAGSAHTVTVPLVELTVYYKVNPTFNQSSYQWFENADSAAPVDVGAPLNGAARNTATTAPSGGAIFRLRMALHVGTSSAPGGTYSFNLTYAQQGSDGLCDTGLVGETYVGVTASSSIAYANNPVAVDGATLAANTNDPQHGTDTLVRQSYEEANTFALSVTTASGEDALWDFALKDNGAPANTTYCFRVATTGYANISSYSVIPQITTSPANVTQAGYQWFEGQDGAVKNTFAQTLSASPQLFVQDMLQASDGSYVATGSNGNGPILAKFDASGRPLFTTAFAGSQTTPKSVIETGDGGYAIAGFTFDFGSTNLDSFIAKFDNSGGLSWLKRWGGANNQSVDSVVETLDGGYVTTGSTNGDIAITKLDFEGSIIWQKAWTDTASTDSGNDIALTPDGGYIIVGATRTLSVILKLDSDGRLAWEVPLAHYTGGVSNAVTVNSDGSFAVTGRTEGDIGGSDGFIAKFTSSGEYLWGSAFGGAGYEMGSSIVSTSDGGYAVAGATSSVGPGPGSAFLVKFTSTGVQDWSRQFYTLGETEAYSVTHTADGGYAIAGYNMDESQPFMAKYSDLGAIQGCSAMYCSSTFFTSTSMAVYPSSISGTLSSTSFTGAAASPASSSTSINVTIVAGHLTYANTYGGTSNDSIEATATTADGGYVTAGNSNSYSAGGKDVIVSKYTSLGELSWSRQWGGASDDVAVDITETGDGKIAVIANTKSYGGGDTDMAVLSYSSTGTLLQMTTWGSSGTEDGAGAIYATDDDGTVIVGYTDVSGTGDLDAVVVKFSNLGFEEWVTVLGSFGYGDYGVDIIQVPATGDYVVLGHHFKASTLSNDVFLAGIASDGYFSWENGWVSSAEEYATALTTTADGGVAAIGYTDEFGGNDTLVLKLDNNWVLEWAKVWDNADNGTDTFHSIVQSSDGGFAIAGSAETYTPAATRAHLLKLDGNGGVEFSRTFGNTGASEFKEVIQTSDGGYLTAGYTNDYGSGQQDMLIVKYDDNGQMYGCATTPCGVLNGSMSSSFIGYDASGVSGAIYFLPSNTPGLSSTTINPTKSTVTNSAVWGTLRPTVKSPLAAQNTVAASSRHDTPLRLRAVIGATSNTILSDSVSLKLQVAPKVGTCDPAFVGEVYVDIGSSAAFNYYDNADLSSGAFILPGTTDPSPASGSRYFGAYYESSGFSNRHAIGTLRSEIIDIAITPTDATVYGSYCFRMGKHRQQTTSKLRTYNGTKLTTCDKSATTPRAIL